MRQSMRAVVLWLLLVACGCSDGDLRGKTVPSADGKTYLVVEDDNGGGCGPIQVDGAVWLTELYKPGPITPGAHQISCGYGDSGITFEVEPGTTFHFDYWGP